MCTREMGMHVMWCFQNAPAADASTSFVSETSKSGKKKKKKKTMKKRKKKRKDWG